MDFHQIFRIYKPQEDLKLICFGRVSGNSCCHSNILNTFRTFNSRGGSSYQKYLISPLLLVLGVWNMKTTYNKSSPVNLLQVSKLPLTPASRSSWVIMLKVLISPLLFVLRIPIVKTTYRKSWPTNLLHASNLTLDPCFKVMLGHNAKRALYHLCIGSWAWNSHHD